MHVCVCVLGMWCFYAAIWRADVQHKALHTPAHVPAQTTTRRCLAMRSTWRRHGGRGRWCGSWGCCGKGTASATAPGAFVC